MDTLLNYVIIYANWISRLVRWTIQSKFGQAILKYGSKLCLNTLIHNFNAVMKSQMLIVAYESYFQLSWLKVSYSTMNTSRWSLIDFEVVLTKILAI